MINIFCSGSTWSTGFNRLCGINPDQHFYVHLDKNVCSFSIFFLLQFFFQISTTMFIMTKMFVSCIVPMFFYSARSTLNNTSVQVSCDLFISSQYDLWVFDAQVGFQHVDFTITSVTKNVPYKFGLWITQVVREVFPSSTFFYVNQWPIPSQIDCYDGSSVMAPGGCTQLHFGLEGIIKSFNFEGVQYLNNQNYHSCIRLQSFSKLCLKYCLGLSGDLATSSFRLMPTISCWNLSLQKEEEVHMHNIIWVKRQK